MRMAHEPLNLGSPSVIDVSHGTLSDAPADAILVCYGSHEGRCPVLVDLGHPEPTGEHGVVLAINERDAVHFAYADSYRRVLRAETPLLLVNRVGPGLTQPGEQGSIE